jgi:hypothetical protein
MDQEPNLTPTFDPNQLAFAEIEPSFAGEGKGLDDLIVVSNVQSGELLRILPNGEVVAPSIEAASEAGRVFVEAIRANLTQIPLSLG